MSMDQNLIDAIGRHVAQQDAAAERGDGDAVAIVFSGMGLERGDRVVTAEWGKPFTCPTTGNTVLWIQRPGFDGFIKVTYQVEERPHYQPPCGIASA